jgi:hypothetical protein
MVQGMAKRYLEKVSDQWPFDPVEVALKNSRKWGSQRKWAVAGGDGLRS